MFKKLFILLTLSSYIYGADYSVVQGENAQACITPQDLTFESREMFFQQFLEQQSPQDKQTIANIHRILLKASLVICDVIAATYSKNKVILQQSVTENYADFWYEYTVELPFFFSDIEFIIKSDFYQELIDTAMDNEDYSEPLVAMQNTAKKMYAVVGLMPEQEEYETIARTPIIGIIKDKLGKDIACLRENMPSMSQVLVRSGMEEIKLRASEIRSLCDQLCIEINALINSGMNERLVGNYLLWCMQNVVETMNASLCEAARFNVPEDLHKRSVQELNPEEIQLIFNFCDYCFLLCSHIMEQELAKLG